MSLVADLVESYQRVVTLPWSGAVAHRQRVWMVVYPPDQERRLRVHVGEFGLATTKAERGWRLVEIDGVFEQWLANHKYRDQYFAEPKLLQPAMERFARHLSDHVQTELDAATEDDVVAILGIGSLFGLGPQVRASALVEEVSSHISGRLLVFFPGRVDGSNYRLLDARDGWNYLAVPITADGGRK